MPAAFRGGIGIAAAFVTPCITAVTCEMWSQSRSNTAAFVTPCITAVTCEMCVSLDQIRLPLVTPCITAVTCEMCVSLDQIRQPLVTPCITAHVTAHRASRTCAAHAAVVRGEHARHPLSRGKEGKVRACLPRKARFWHVYLLISREGRQGSCMCRGGSELVAALPRRPAASMPAPGCEIRRLREKAASVAPRCVATPPTHTHDKAASRPARRLRSAFGSSRHASTPA